MKKIFVIVFLIFMCTEIFGLTGNANLIPVKIARGTYGNTIEITYYPGSDIIWNDGLISIIIPEDFPTLPTVSPGYPGEIKVSYFRNGATIEPISQSNITIDGRAITITAINLNPNDSLQIVYGTKDNGGSGVQAPYMPGVFYFLMYERPTSTSGFVALENPPKIKVTMLDLTKSANVTSVMAKNTFTYSLNYTNISNMYSVNEVVVWDTLPQGLKFIYSDISPTSQSNNYLLWNLGTVNYGNNGVLNIVVEAQPGIINYGEIITNTAKIQGSDGYGVYLEEAINNIQVFGVKLVSTIYATPSIVILDENFTVLMNVQNMGNYHAYNVSPTALTIYGSGNATKISGPVPASVSSLTQGSTVVFTWVYRATGSGEIYFSGKATGQENTLIIESNATNSNAITLLMPTNTSTPINTYTFTPQHTKTFTRTPTQIITLTLTPTDTRQEQITLTPTNTQEELITPTFTNTEVVILTPTSTETEKPTNTNTPTFINTVIPTATPDAIVYIDRNYFKPMNNEKIKINYKVLEQGIVDIQIYNLSGEIILSYSKNYSAITTDFYYWDGKNSAGKIVSRGIYFIVIKQKTQIIMKKIVVLK